MEGEERWEPGGEENGLPALAGTVRFAVELEHLPHQILAHVQAEAVALLVCDRCLGEFSQPVRLDYAEIYQTPEERQRWPGREEEEVDRPTRLLDPAGTTIDLEEGFRENLLLDLPLKRLCRPDCRGLCPVCGANLNEADCGHAGAGAPDLRWAALERLRFPGAAAEGEGREKDGQS
ncbi:MAG: DUF177 domain-containing protein [Bacillota bacterium]|nr:DUF177 domain-containing protein [Bacillota bacterium]